MELIFVTLLVSNLYPKSKLVIAVYPHEENIPTMSVTLFVSNLSPKSKLVIAVYPHDINILFILVTLLVSNLSPKSKLVIAVYPQSWNIPSIFVAVTVFKYSNPFITFSAVQLESYPIYENKYPESWFAHINSSLPIYT